MKVLEIPQSGRLGKKVFYRRGKVQCRRVYIVPADRHTPEQRRSRRRMRSLARAFGKATDEQQNAWSASAAREQSRPRLGDSGLLTGLQHFTGRNSVLAMVGRKRLLWPPQRVRFGANPVKGLRLGWVNERLKLELKVSGAVTEDVMVFGQAPLQRGAQEMAARCLPGPAAAHAGRGVRHCRALHREVRRTQARRQDLHPHPAAAGWLGEPPERR